jgi:hypothetical protein
MPNPVTGKIGLFELPGHVTGPGVAIQGSEIDAGAIAAANIAAGAITGALIPQGGVTPDQVGISVWNATGSTLAAGALVYLSGYNAANALLQVTLTDGNFWTKRAQWVVLAPILNGAKGLVGAHYRLTGLNTNAATVGDSVYLDNGTPGNWTLGPPGGVLQVVGRVTAKSATVGMIDFNLLSGISALQPRRVNAAFMPTTIPTTGTAEAIIIVPETGVLTNFRVGGSVLLATDNTNFIQFSAVNRGHVDGTGNTALLNVASGASSTKTTGGGALAAYAGTSMVPTSALQAVAANDVIQFIATVNGILANTVPEAWVSMGLVPTGA